MGKGIPLLTVMALLAAAIPPLLAQETEPAQAQAQAPAAGQVLYEIKPSDTDSAIRHFDAPHWVLIDPHAAPTAQLVVFMPGTDGRPAGARKLLSLVAAQGYRVIGLEYDDTPAVVETCPRDPSARCSEDFRRRRVFGETDAHVVDNPPEESVVHRLVALLQYLSRAHPDESWDRYLAGDTPAWDRIVVSGLSQGAGMAAYIAKRVEVARVVLFSSPWDYYGGRSRVLAPWLAAASATPPERWYAEYHRRENTADLLEHAYLMLRIPRDHVFVFDLGLPPNASRSGHNPYHGSTVHNTDYAPQWRMMFGASP